MSFANMWQQTLITLRGLEAYPEFTRQ